MSQAFHSMQTNPYSDHPLALEKAAQVKLLVLDVDGVLTDGSLWIGQDGKEELKVFDSLDGHGIKMLQSTGVQVAIITGRSSAMVQGRAKELGIELIWMAVKHKADALKELLQKTDLKLSDCAAMGDDWPDLSILPKVGFAACPAQAHPEVKKHVHFQTQKCGGQGAVRELCDLILTAQDNYDHLLQEALR